MARKKIIAGNWKMHLVLTEAQQLVQDIKQYVETSKPNCEVILCPPSIYLANTKNQLQNSPIKIGAQNCFHLPQGPYTGEIGASMIKSLGVNYVLVGHSERRDYFNETAKQLLGKITLILKNNLIPIFCCGEPLQERKSGNHINYVKNQIEEVLFQLSAPEISTFILAYEPIWAIGTGETATPEQAQEMHAEIRMFLSKKFGNQIAENLPILYGGSVKPDNAAQLFAKPDIDGALVGGASLNSSSFNEIITAAK